MPTYPWRQAPAGLATRRQLRARGLRPGGRDPVAQIVCRRGQRVAYLYDIDAALPVRPMTPARAAALDRAMAARQTCPDCGIRYPYCLPLRTLGTCPLCADGYATAA
ncbi:RRQRL motif-containing zinc-binding protein [Streptomyces sp. NPDC007063]|uniref:RRQRL motif-containing zinc-binding protein n=1 Tax=Streptomyces sp. NPDC007063 TaxID=3364772 RepID=UPI0036B2A7F6